MNLIVVHNDIDLRELARRTRPINEAQQVSKEPTILAFIEDYQIGVCNSERDNMTESSCCSVVAFTNHLFNDLTV